MLTQDTIKLAEYAHKSALDLKGHILDLFDKEKTAVDTPRSKERQQKLRIFSDQADSIRAELETLYG